MIGADTNILLRFFLGDSPDQQRSAAGLLTAPRDGICVNAVTLAEFVWVLQRRKKIGRAALARFCRNLLRMRSLYVPDAEAFFRAVERFESGRAGLGDYFIAELNAAHGASPTYTFDKTAASDPPFALLT